MKAFTTPFAAALLAISACADQPLSPTELDWFEEGGESLSIERAAGADAITISHVQDGQTRTVTMTTAQLEADHRDLGQLIDGVDPALLERARAEVLSRPVGSELEAEFKGCEMAVLGAGGEPEEQGDGTLGVAEENRDVCELCCWTSYAICYWGNIEHMGALDAGLYCGSIYGCCC